MANYLVRFLLCFSILLSSGYSAIYANADRNNAVESYGASFETTLGVNSTRQHPLSYTSSKELGKDLSAVNNSKVEEKDDDDSSTNTFLDYHYFNELHFSRILRFLFQDLSGDLHFSKFIPHTSTLRLHLVIQVFRI